MYGTIPSEISQLSNLGILNLENNNFKGPIPTEIGLMTSLHTRTAHQEWHNTNDGMSFKILIINYQLQEELF